MDERTMRILDDRTRAFYLACADSFSETRQAPWPGWEPVARRLAEATQDGNPVRLLDVGCGNLRFERFLLDRSVGFRALALDRCEALAVAGLAADPRLSGCCRIGPFDALRDADVPGGRQAFSAAVAFALLHHIPGHDERMALLKSMACRLQEGGLLALSLWDLDSDARLSRKARRDTDRACRALGLGPLDEGDFVLGWQHRDDAFRYCHSFSGEEADRIIGQLSGELRLVERYRSDGPSGCANRYLLFSKRALSSPSTEQPL